MKKVIAIGSVLFGVVFLAGCGQQPVSQTQPTTSTPVAQTPTQPANETADWQTYRNEKLGIVFQYPGDLVNIDSKNDLNSVNIWGKATQIPGISFSVKPMPVEINQTWISDQGLYLLTNNKATIAGRQADVAMGQEILSGIKLYIIKNNSQVLLVEQSIVADDKAVFDQILSTLEFTK